MRILWLAPYVPLRIFGGGTRVFNLIKALAQSCTIDLIASGALPPPDDEMARQLRSFCRRVEIVPSIAPSRHAKRLRQMRALASRRPAQYWTFYSPGMQARIDQAVREEVYDVVILEHSFTGYYSVPGRIPTVLDQHNVESDLLRRASQSERSVLRRTFSFLEWRKYQADEQRLCSAVDLLLATSERDRTAMEAWGAIPPCVVIPNGVDTAYFTPMEGPVGVEPSDVVFTGAMHYAPNVDAVLHFMAETWPLVERSIPHATLRIVGGAPPPPILRLTERPNVQVISAVPDIRPYVAGAHVVVAPLRIGGGTRLKILEALAMGRPVVSTSLGCEGLDLQAGHHLLVADEPAAFASAITELLGDPARRAALGCAGRRLVEERFDWGSIGLRLTEALARVQELTRQPALGRQPQGQPIVAGLASSALPRDSTTM